MQLKISVDPQTKLSRVNMPQNWIEGADTQITNNNQSITNKM